MSSSNSIAREVFEYNFEMQKRGSFNGHGPILPPNVVGKYITTYSNGMPYQNAIIFEDGSELTISYEGQLYWSKAGEWKAEDPEHFKVNADQVKKPA